MKLSRREFLKTAATGAVSVAAMGMMSAVSAIEGENAAADFSGFPGYISDAELAESVVETAPVSEFAASYDYDVVVVGAGTSGIPAALSAVEAGAKVAVLQKQDMVVAQGMLAARVVLSESSEAGVMSYVSYNHKLYDHRPDISLWKAFAYNSQEALEWYEAKLAEVGFENYRESDSKNHIYEDGNCQVKGILFPKSMLEPSTVLAELAASKGVDFYYATPAVQLLGDASGITGVVGKKDDGSYIRFNASKGVILATGDYQNNTAMMNKYVKDATLFPPKQSMKTGDGHLMGMLAGAVIEPAPHCKMIHHHTGANVLREEPLFAVNMNGERFMYEDVEYGRRNTILRDQPDHCMVSVFDANYSDYVYGWGSDPTVPTVANGTPEKIAGFVENGQMYKADTLEDLAAQIGLPVETFMANVARYNELCAKGVDLDFGKPAKYMKPVDTAPFYGVVRTFAIPAIPAGLIVDANGQCKAEDGQLIPGLFAAGNCSGPFFSDVDYSLDTMGLSIGRCITCGYVTGKFAASL